jgi:broad specificity phosphatase PhoE
VLDAVAAALARFPSQRIGIEAHGLTLALIKAWLIGAAVDEIWELIPPNAEVEEFSIDSRRPLAAGELSEEA